MPGKIISTYLWLWKLSTIIYWKWLLHFHLFKFLGDITPEGIQLNPPANHWDPKNPKMRPPKGHDVSRIYLSPSIHYSGCNVYAPKYEYV